MTELSHPKKLLASHIINIANFDKTDELFYDIALFHDLGKVTKSFQEYIQKLSKNANPHSIISAVYFLLNFCEKYSEKELVFGANSIISHHGKLKSINELLNSFINNQKLIKSQFSEILANKTALLFFKISNVDFSKLEDLSYDFEEIEFDVDDYIRQKELFSKLIFADKFEAIFSQSPNFKKQNFDILCLEDYKIKKGFSKNDERDKAKDEIIRNFNNNSNEKIYLITAPTGIGKTLISLEIALKIKEAQSKNRIIYTIPFTSIIDQVGQIFNEIFPNQITIHHHRSEFKTDNEEQNNNYERLKYITQSWSEPFIISTFYQLFFAIFSNKNSDNIKFQSLKNAVVVLDEVQAIPFELWQVMRSFFEKIAANLNTTFVLMSATMPIVSNNACELANKNELYFQKNRYRLSFLKDEKMQIDQICERIIKEYYNNKSVLCVVNTIKTSKILFKKLSQNLQNQEDIFCLNSYMLQNDRKNAINSITKQNKNQVKHKILISTQVIEAGVDLDFDVGFREFAPLSSIIQTAGRVNREGRKTQADIFLFELDGVGIYDAILINETKKSLKTALNPNLEEKNILSFIEEHFKAISNCIQDRFGILKHIKNFDINEISNANDKAFGLEKDYTISVVLGVNLKDYEEEYYQKARNFDKWELKNFKEQQFKEISKNLINIKSKDLEQCGINYEKSEIYGIYYINEAENLYSQKSGFLINDEKDAVETFS